MSDSKQNQTNSSKKSSHKFGASNSAPFTSEQTKVQQWSSGDEEEKPKA